MVEASFHEEKFECKNEYKNWIPLESLSIIYSTWTEAQESSVIIA